MRHPADVARAICGAQAQELSAGRLAFRARSPRLRAVDVDRARTEERSLLRTWVMRRTMHLIATEDEAWLAPLFERAFADNSSRRLAQLGVDPATQERGLREIRKALDRRRAADPARPGGAPSPQGDRPRFVHPPAPVRAGGRPRDRLPRPGRGVADLPRPQRRTGWASDPRPAAKPLSASWPAVTCAPSARRPRPTSRAGPASACGRSARRSPASPAS